jgi:hypothetical protein
VGVSEQLATPGTQITTGRVDHHDRRLATLKDIDIVAGIDRHMADDAIGDMGWQYTPGPHHGVPPVTKENDEITHGVGSLHHGHPVTEPRRRCENR